jgi:asparagine synthase (glutamine-hydrolysing)
MCGISGIFRFSGAGDDVAAVGHMVDHLSRRGPDDAGVVSRGPVVLGHRRLAILDRSAAGHQPMLTRSGRFVITLNGEIYNYRELCRELGIEPGSLRSSSDTEVLLLAWERWGWAALDRLVGQWAFAMFDAAENRLWLARDRFGEKPLFLHVDAQRLAFASSLSALLLAPGTPRELDPGAIVEYLTLRYVVHPRTVLRGVRKLAPGHCLEIGPDGTVREREWYAPRFRATPHRKPRSQAALDEEFDALFTQACSRCLASDVPVGLLLSDGIDSHSIRSALRKEGHVPPSFTFRLRNPRSGTQPARLGCEGGEVCDVEVSPEERFAGIDHALAALTEPVGDGASLATWMLIRGARKRATVFLCGHGGDELLGGYRLSQDRFRLAALRGLAWLPGPLLERPLDRFLFGDDSVAVRRERYRTLPPREAPAAASYLVDRPLPPELVRELVGGALPEEEPYLGTIAALYRECALGAADLNRIQEVLMRTFLSANILSFADSVAMDHAAELRMPFLDRDLVSFSLSLPPGQRISRWPGRSNTKRILRRWSLGRVPEDVVKRPKRGFQSGDISELLRHDLAGVRDRILGAEALRRVVPGAERWLDRTRTDDAGPWGGTLWGLLALGVWCQAVGVR